MSSSDESIPAQKRGSGCGKKKGINADLPLPASLLNLIHAFALVDATICFLLRKHLPCTFGKILSMLSVTSATGTTKFTEESFRRLVTVGADMFAVRQIPRASDWEHLLSPTSTGKTGGTEGVNPLGSPTAFYSPPQSSKPLKHGTMSTYTYNMPALPDIDLVEDEDAGMLLKPSASTAAHSAGVVGKPTLPVTAATTAAPAVSAQAVPPTDKLDWIEIVFSNAGGGAAKVAQRRKEFRQRLQFVKAEHEKQFPAVASSTELKQWDPAFSLESVPDVPLATLPGEAATTGSRCVTPPPFPAFDTIEDRITRSVNRAGAVTPPCVPSFESIEAAGNRFVTSGSSHALAAFAEVRKLKMTASPGGVSSAISALTNLGDRRNKYVPDEAVSVNPLPAPPTIHTLEEYLKAQPWYVDQLLSSEERPGKPPEFAPFPSGIPSPVLSSLRRNGITKLYKHQATAIQAALDGKHVVISTSTSSGKSLTYNVPVFTRLLGVEKSIALYIFPTKALAQDQLRALHEFIGTDDALSCIRPACLDGDTSFAERKDVLKHANIILTNPDILHVTLLPQHRHWRELLKAIRFIVIDEAHTYRGVFGSHVALVFRRLLRVLDFYGSSPQFIACSATISNPMEHFEHLVPHSAANSVLLTPADDASAVGLRKFIMWQPPILAETRLSPPAAAVETESTTKKKKTGKGGNVGGKKRRRRSSPLLSSLLDDETGELLPVFGYEDTACFDDASVSTSDASVQTDCVGALMFRPHDYGQRSGLHSHSHSNTTTTTTTTKAVVPGRGGTTSAPGSRFGAPAFRNPSNYRRSVLDAPSAMLRATAGTDVSPVPKWVTRWLEQKGSTSETRRRSALVEASIVLAALVEGGLRTITFCRIRKVAELLLQYTHERLATSPCGVKLVPLVKSYRAGYLKEHRRAIESALFGGQLMGVVATNALELGVDIGCLDVVLMLGYPGSVASTWQQAGRAGRGGRDSAAIFVAYDSPTDQFFVRNPLEFTSKAPEAACVHLENERLLRAHLLCAGAELPLSPTDVAAFGEAIGPVVLKLREENLLLQNVEATGDRATLNGDQLFTLTTAPWVDKPASRVNLRSIDDVIYKVIDDGNGGAIVDEVEESRAFWEIHEGAMYLNQGVTYKVDYLSIDAKEAHVHVSTEQYYTHLRDHTDVNALSRTATTQHGHTKFGRVQVIKHAWGFTKIWKRSGLVFETCDLSLPPIEYLTQAIWYDMTLALKSSLDAAGLDFLGGCHGASHAVMSVLPLFVMCDHADLGTECPSPVQIRARPLRFIVYDKHPGGVGIAEAAFKVAGDVMKAALNLVSVCPCDDGCPACIHYMHCAEFNYVLDKRATLAILQAAVSDFADKPDGE
jgi:DEAD/DEAH box helicase domain-containing protein